MIRSSLLVIAILLSFIACKNKNVEQIKTKRPVKAMQVGLQETFGSRKFPGRAEASDEVTLAFEVSGKLNKIKVNIGDKVRKGSVLASVDSRDFKNALDQARAELKRAKAQFDRVKKAVADNAVSKQQVTDAEAAFESAKAVVKIREKAYSDTKLIAPFSGVVVSKFVKSFENIQAKQNIIRIVDINQIEMVANIPEDIIGLAEKGMNISVEFDVFPGVVVQSKISEIGTEATQGTRTFPVILIMDQPKEITILPGMSGKAWRTPTGKLSRNTISNSISGYEIPVTAIKSETNGKTYVWVIDKSSGSVSKKEIQTGELTKNGVLVKGLQGGELIATAGVNSLTENQQVRVIN